MTITIIILVLLILGEFGYFKFVLWKDDKDYMEEYKEIFEAHKNIGYPELSMENQFKILDNEDLSSIKQLTDFDFVPGGLLDNYITIEPDEYFKHLKNSNLFEKMNIDKLEDKLMDGFYIEQTGNSFRYVFNDRRSRVFEKEFESEDKLLKYLVFDRLRMYAPKYKKTIKKKYYA
jgi:hypothetical protein